MRSVDITRITLLPCDSAADGINKSQMGIWVNRYCRLNSVR